MPLMKYELMDWFFSSIRLSHVNLLGKTVTFGMLLPLGAFIIKSYLQGPNV